MADYRETITWLMEMKGDLQAEADETAAAIRDMGKASDAARKELKDLQAQMRSMEKDSDAYRAAESKAKGLQNQIEKNTAATKALREEQAIANEATKVGEKNLLGMASAAGAVASGIAIAGTAVAAYVTHVVEANDRLHTLGINTGDASKTVDRYKESVDGLTTSFDKLFVTLSGSGFERLEKLSTILTNLADRAAAGDAGPIDSKWAWYVATMGVGPAASAAVDATLDRFGTRPRGGVGMGDLKLLEGKIKPITHYEDLVGPVTSDLGTSGRDFYTPPPLRKLITAVPGLSGRDYQGLYGVGGIALPERLGNLAGTTVSSTIGGPGLDIAYQNLAATVFPTRTPHPINQAAIAGGISSFGSGNLATTLGAINPIAGAVAAVAPNLGGTFDALEHQLVHLPEQLVDGITHIFEELPTFIGKVIPDVIAGLIAAVPEIAVGLLASLPEILVSVFTGLFEELPRKLAEALREVVFPEHTDAQRASIQKTRDVLAAAGGPGSLAALMADAPQPGSRRRSSGGGGGVHIHVHGGSAQDQARAIRKVIGSYGLNESVEGLVTA